MIVKKGLHRNNTKGVGGNHEGYVSKRGRLERTTTLLSNIEVKTKGKREEEQIKMRREREKRVFQRKTEYSGIGETKQKRE